MRRWSAADPNLAYAVARITCWLLAAALWACNAYPTAQAGPLYTHEERRFRVTVNPPASAQDVLRVEVAPRAPWKLAEQFPCRLDLRGPDLRLEPVAFSEESAAFQTWSYCVIPSNTFLKSVDKGA